MEGNSPYITNLVNSIIGVSVLAMPFCLKQCGIILGLGLLFSAAWLTYLSCSMLASSAYQKRRRSYEYLALFTLGPTGKFAVELSMIGLMLGTCIAFYVVIGDLSYGTIAKFVPGADASTLRMYTIIFTALCIALPLGNMKNLSVLSYFGFVSLIFYSAFLVVVILNAVSNGLLNWEWLHKVNYWRPAGIFQCLPIFSLAYACQCQLFIVYSSLEEPTVHRVEDIVFGAIRFVTIAYMSIGLFGYTTYQEAIAGNLLLNFPSNVLLDFIKMGFAMSVVLGFPLMISPCRQSIHTLIFAQPAGEGMQTTTYIPPFLFKSITLGIVILTMFIAIVIPNVETILGLTGATMGSMICFIFPALIYEKAHSSKVSSNTPKFVFVLGCILLVVCTYSNLSKITNPTTVELPPKIPDLPEINVDPVKVEGNDVVVKEEHKDSEKELVPNDKEELEKSQVVAEVEGQDHRHEPPNPIEPDNPEALDKQDDVAVIGKDTEKKPDVNNDEAKQDSPKEEVQVNVGVAPKDIAEPPEKLVEEKKEQPVPVEKPKSSVQKIEPPAKQVEESKSEDVNKNIDVVQQPKELVPPQPKNDPPVNKEVPKNPVTLSPKIIRRDDNEPAVDSHVKQDDVAQPRIQQGSPLKEQHVEKVENAQDVVAVANPALKDGPKKSDDAADEKELLEKIKEQHDMQQQLLKEQEQLIKKLEEHQDKKDQAGEEDGQVDGIGQNSHQGAPSQDHKEIKQPVNPPQIENRPIKPLVQNPEIVNNDGLKKDDAVLPQDGALQDVLIDRKPEDVVMKQNENHEGVPSPIGNKAVAGRELLSNENEPHEDIIKESVMNDQVNADGVNSEEIQKNIPVQDTDHVGQQNSFMRHNDQQRIHTESMQPHNPNTPHHYPQNVKVPMAWNNGAGRRVPAEERWLQMQQQMRRAPVKVSTDSDDEVVRKPRDINSQLEDGERNEEIVQVRELTENDGDTRNKEYIPEHNVGIENKDADTEDKMKLTHNEDDLQHQPLNEDKVKEPIEGNQLDSKEPANIPAMSDTEKQHIEVLADKPKLNKENTNQEDFEDMHNHVGESLDEKEVVVDCLENDSECWQSKSKLRELKSLDLN